MVIYISYNGFLCKVTYFSLYIRRKLCILWYKKSFFRHFSTEYCVLWLMIILYRTKTKKSPITFPHERLIDAKKRIFCLMKRLFFLYCVSYSPETRYEFVTLLASAMVIWPSLL